MSKQTNKPNRDAVIAKRKLLFGLYSDIKTQDHQMKESLTIVDQALIGEQNKAFDYLIRVIEERCIRMDS